MTDAEKIQQALDLAYRYGQNDSAHHLQWTIDQIVRVLTGDDYTQWVAEYEGDPEDEENYYTWDTGMPS